MRTSSLELPSAKELRDMIEKESPRLAVRRDYLASYPEIFTTYREVMANADIRTALLDHLLDIGFDDVISMLTELNESVIHFLAAGNFTQKNLYAEGLYQHLNYQVPPRSSDLIVVFGSPVDLRIARAVELFHAGIAPKILVTGRAPHWGVNEISEARRTAQYAVMHGVPDAAILVEDRSIATPDNVKRAIDLLEENIFRPRTITIVTSEFNLRRAYMDMYKFAPWDVEIYTAAPTPSYDLNIENWINTDRGRRIIMNEYAKLIIEAKIDQVLASKTLYQKEG